MNELLSLLSCSPSDPRLSSHIAALASGKDTECQVKEYPGIAYHNYRSLGLSLHFEPLADALQLAAIDLYGGDSTWTQFPRLPLVFRLASGEVTIGAETKGKDFVQQLGEPTRKGGGDAGGGGMGPGLWLEWNLDVMQETESIPVTMLTELKRLPKSALQGGGTRWDLEQAGSCSWYTLTLHHRTA